MLGKSEIGDVELERCVGENVFDILSVCGSDGINIICVGYKMW